jgi:hypothetical protein
MRFLGIIILFVSVFSCKTIELESLSKAKGPDYLKTVEVIANPFHSDTLYDINTLKKRVKIINLPQVCEVIIYNQKGKQVYQIFKNNDWDFAYWYFKDEKGRYVPSGIYFVEINTFDKGKKVVKLTIYHTYS